ncbi:MAG: YqaA family protein [Clostridia bacterium]
MKTLTALSETVTHALMAHGVAGIVAFAFAEAWFFPIPPDVLLVAVATLNPGKALVYALLCTIASSIGGLFGWEIGRKLGRAVFTRPALRDILPVRYVTKAETMFRRHGGLAVAFAALSPGPGVRCHEGTIRLPQCQAGRLLVCQPLSSNPWAPHPPICWQESAVDK